MRIAHVSDLHIRNQKYRVEYRAAFDDLYAKLQILKPDMIINTGDVVHSKLAVSPELFDDVANHMLRMSEIAPYWIILGNHDLNLKNKDRMDAISPIVRALQGRTVHPLELLEPGRVPKTYELGFTFWNYDIRGGYGEFKPYGHDVNIGLYHGSISGCQTDIGFVMEDGEAEVSKFDQMDYVMLGDIHKRQSFRGGRMQYPGSLIQQNYGEELVKGFLMWDIQNKTDFAVDFHSISAPGRFHTIHVPASLDISGVSIPQRSRVRAIVDGELTPSRRMDLERRLRESFEPIEVITPDASGERLQMEVPDIDELIGSRDKVMMDHLAERGATPDEAESVVRLFHQYEAGLDHDGVARGTSWRLKRIAWDNMLNYGEGNVIDLTKINGLVGIFAPNASGKSSIFDIMLQALFDKISKDVPRNIDLVNDNKDSGSMLVELESSGVPFSIERSIERIHYGQRKFVETKQWGKTTLDFSSIDDSMNGSSRPETEREIRKIIGAFEDFALTTMITQNPIFGLPGGADLLNCRETDRRKILFRFLDLDIYEKIANGAKDDLKELMGKFKDLDRTDLEERLAAFIGDRADEESNIAAERGSLLMTEQDLDVVVKALEKASASDVSTLMADLDDARALLGEAHGNSETHRRALEEHRSRRAHLEVQLTEHLAAEPKGPPITLEELHTEINKLRREREGVLVEMSHGKMKRDRGLQSLKTLDGVPCEGKFPSCRFISEAVSFLDERALIEKAIADLTSESLECEYRLARLEDHDVVHKQVAAWDKKKVKVEMEMLQLDGHIAAKRADADFWTDAADRQRGRLEDIQRKLVEVSLDEIQSLKSQERRLRKLLDEMQTGIDRRLKAIGALDSKIEAVHADIASLDGLKERVSMHERLLEMCGKNGLPYRVLAMVLPVINAEIAKILAGIVKFSVFFEDDPDEQTVSLFIRYGDYKSRPLSMGSGAEKFISSLAIRTALLSVSSLPKTDILIIDEGFGRLDPEYLDALQRMFEYLREAFGIVFIVSHVDFMRDIVDHSIEITSRDGYAHVEVE